MSKIFLSLAAGLLLVSGSAFADTFKFFSPGTVTWNGVYVNPYLANDLTQPAQNPLTIYCDDWNTSFSGTPTWKANVYDLTLINAPNFKYGNTTPNYNVSLSDGNLTWALSSTPTPFNRYLEAAWLNEQFEAELASGDSQAVKEDTQKRIAAAVWTLFVNGSEVSGLIGAINSSGYGTSVYDYLVAAKDQVDNHAYTAPNWDVIVPAGNTFAMQEFLVHGFSGDTTVPEPGTVILLGSIVGFLTIKKFRNKRQA